MLYYVILMMKLLRLVLATVDQGWEIASEGMLGLQRWDTLVWSYWLCWCLLFSVPQHLYKSLMLQTWRTIHLTLALLQWMITAMNTPITVINSSKSVTPASLSTQQLKEDCLLKQVQKLIRAQYLMLRLALHIMLQEIKMTESSSIYTVRMDLFLSTSLS